MILGLLTSFYDDAGVIAINSHLFSLLDVGSTNEDGDVLEVGAAVSSLRFFVHLLELGVGDALVTGAAVHDLVFANFPRLHAFLNDPEYGVRRPRDSRLNYTQFCQNFKHLMVSYLN